MEIVRFLKKEEGAAGTGIAFQPVTEALLVELSTCSGCERASAGSGRWERRAAPVSPSLSCGGLSGSHTVCSGAEPVPEELEC